MRFTSPLAKTLAFVVFSGAAWPIPPSAAAMQPSKQCLVGGTGAESCTLTDGDVQCEVECNAGYYACCGITTIEQGDTSYTSSCECLR